MGFFSRCCIGVGFEGDDKLNLEASIKDVFETINPMKVSIYFSFIINTQNLLGSNFGYQSKHPIGL